jgi:hypothetical protein
VDESHPRESLLDENIFDQNQNQNQNQAMSGSNNKNNNNNNNNSNNNNEYDNGTISNTGVEIPAVTRVFDQSSEEDSALIDQIMRIETRVMVAAKKARDMCTCFDDMCTHVLTLADRGNVAKRDGLLIKKTFVAHVAFSKKVADMWHEIMEDVESRSRVFEFDLTTKMLQNA